MTKNLNPTLPRAFSFKTASDLVRIGKDYDGGYLVSQADIDKTDLLIGLGISDDWSFESDFVKKNDVEVFAYDASVNLRFWLKYFLTQTLKNPFNFYAFRKFISYKAFFRGKHKHIKKFVGLNCNNKLHCTLSSILNDFDKNNIFLKIDVEGSEYRFLDTLISNEKRISGLVLELHDCDLHLELISTFVEKFNLKLVHIHANNFSQIRADDGLPLVLELTFSSYCKTQNKPSLPHQLDMPNNRNAEEIQLTLTV